MTQRGEIQTGDKGIPATYGFGRDALRSRLDDLSEADLLALGDCAAGRGPRAGRVSALLSLVYDLPGQPFQPERLSMIDRAAALFGVACRIGQWPARFVSRCAECGTGDELRVAPGEFTYTPAQAYEVEVGGSWLMQPNGYHEVALEQGAALPLADLAISGDVADEAAALAALQQAAPGFAADLPYRCLACGAENRFWFDPMDWIARHTRALLDEVHRLASAYGWTEAEILALPRARREAYIGLIEGSGG